MLMVIISYSSHNCLVIFDSYLVSMLVGIILYLLFFGNRLGYVVSYPLISLDKYRGGM